MIENCLRHKIIRDFLKHYTENKWKDLIPSLIEIGILNLQKSFNKIIFTSDELKKVSRHLQISQIEKDKEKSKEKIKENKEKDNEKIIDIKNEPKDEEKEEKNKLIKSQSKQNETPKSNINGGNINNINNNIQRMKMIDIVQNNPEKQEKMKSCTEAIIEMKNNIKNNFQYFKNNISIDFKNKLTKQKGEYYKKINIEKNKNNPKKHIDKISYAISYDKDLRPASISKKINNTQNNINNRNNKAEYDNINYNINQNYSSEKRSKNNSKSKSKKYKNKEKYLNLNLNNLNRINNMQSVKRKHYNFNKVYNKNEIIRTAANDKNNYYKKLNIAQRHNVTNNEINNNNYHVVKVGRPQINKKKGQNNIFNNNISNSYNNNYRNINFINTLYQRVNSNGQAIKISNDNYFSNREELNEFIKNNRIKLNVKQELNYKKNLTKSEKPSDRKNNFLNLDDKDKGKEKAIFSDCKNSKTNLQNKKNSNFKIFNKDEIDYKNELLRSYPNKTDFMKLNKSNSKTPKNTINTDNEKGAISITNSKDKINDAQNSKNIKNNDEGDKVKKVEDKKNENNTGLKTIKIFDLNKEKNSEKKLFEKDNGKNGDRYFNIFGCEAEDISLTQIEKDFSGIIDSSTSNEIQLNPEYFFKETPRNIFKINKSNDQSINSNNNEDNNGK